MRQGDPIGPLTGIAAILIALVRRDLLAVLRQPSDAVMTIVFFIIMVSLFPLGVGPEPQLLRRMAAGVVWVAALLSSMLALHRLFAIDYADGTLEQMLIGIVPLPLIVLAKVVAHWLVTGLPLVLLAPLLGLQFDLSQDALVALAIGLLIGTPALCLIGAIGAALTLGLRGGGALLSLLVLPLYIPILIFGTGAVDATDAGLGMGAHLSLSGALLVAALVVAPWVAAMALRISME